MTGPWPKRGNVDSYKCNTVCIARRAPGDNRAGVVGMQPCLRSCPGPETKQGTGKESHVKLDPITAAPPLRHEYDVEPTLGWDRGANGLLGGHQSETTNTATLDTLGCRIKQDMERDLFGGGGFGIRGNFAAL